MNHRRRSLIAGVVLITVGVLLLIAQLTGGWGDDLFLLVIGAGFITAYFYRQQYGLLIPGGILTGLGLGSLVEQIPSLQGDGSTLGLGIGFLAIYLLDLLNTGSTHWWPLVPGSLLVLTSLAESYEPFEELLAVGWPMLLILGGVWLLIRVFRSR